MGTVLGVDIESKGKASLPDSTQASDSSRACSQDSLMEYSSQGALLMSTACEHLQNHCGLDVAEGLQ